VCPYIQFSEFHHWPHQWVQWPLSVWGYIRDSELEFMLGKHVRFLVVRCRYVSKHLLRRSARIDIFISGSWMLIVFPLSHLPADDHFPNLYHSNHQQPSNMSVQVSGSTKPTLQTNRLPGMHINQPPSGAPLVRDVHDVFAVSVSSQPNSNLKRYQQR
jgi:hypothetical protein